MDLSACSSGQLVLWAALAPFTAGSLFDVNRAPSASLRVLNLPSPDLNGFLPFCQRRLVLRISNSYSLSLLTLEGKEFVSLSIFMFTGPKQLVTGPS